MVALGLALIVLSGVATLGVVLSNTAHLAGASAFGITLSHVSIGGFFLAGAVAGLIFGLGLAMMLAGGARKRHRSRQTKQTVRSARSEQAQLAAENERLRQEAADRGTSGVTVTHEVPVDRVEERHGLFRR